MFENDNEILSFRKTLKQVVKDLETIHNCQIKEFQEIIIEKFDRYSYEGEDEVVGFDKWEDISNDGKYELQVGINHEHAYVFTIFVTVHNSSVTVTNVL
ncbi:MAG: hypothetical protein PHF17_00770 [Arcobacteraceae bacterium]|jgi:hypothetical protein|nr:hypothetical protein [Arcobacteraceae bacterium]